MQPAQQSNASPHLQLRQIQSHPGSSPASLVSSSTKDNLRSRVRLPAAIDSSLLPQAHSSRLLYSQALLSDQKKALQPDYKTAFQSANDIVRRLLPYHVWHVDNTDLNHILSLDDRKRKVDEEDKAYPSSDETYRLFSRYSRIARRAKRLQSELDGAGSSDNAAEYGKETLYNLEKLSTEHERQLLNQEQDKLRRAKEGAINAGVSWESLMRLSASFGQTYMHGQGSMTTPLDSMASTSSTFGGSAIYGSFQQNAATMPMHPNTPRPPPPASNLGQSQISSLHAVPSPTTPRPPIAKGARPRGRPRKSLGMPPFTPRNQTPTSAFSTSSMTPTPPRPFHTPQSSNGTNKASSSNQPPPNTNTPVKDLSKGKPTTSTMTSTASIPSHPIPLVLPLSTLAQLSALGIAPIPAPHLLPAISAQQAHAQRLAQSQGANSPTNTTPPASSTTSTASSIPLTPAVHSTAPRPAPLNQQEPALLMGITEAPLAPVREVPEGKTSTTTAKSNATTQQMLHISVVLSKLTPSQLSGLATLMQGLQVNATNQKASPAANDETATSSTRGASNRNT